MSRLTQMARLESELMKEQNTLIVLQELQADMELENEDTRNNQHIQLLTKQRIDKLEEEVLEALVDDRVCL